MNQLSDQSITGRHASPDPHRSERGVALVVVLLLTVALSAIGASLLLLAQTDTYTSMNYRMMSQARYGAESGVLKAVNFLTQAYQTPGTAGDPYASYNVTVSPVTFNGQPVVLSADPAKASNYQDAVTQAAFLAASTGNIVSGQTVTYTAYATLVGMRTVEEYGVTTPTIIQTWEVTGTGTIGGARPAAVEVKTTLERQVTAAHNYGVFATNPGCGALTFSGGSSTDSYNSATMTFASGLPVTQTYGGSVGSNGNLNVNGGQTQINGSLSTPRSGVGNCKNGNVTAYTGGAAQVSEGLVQLPQAISYPTPSAVIPVPPTSNVSWSGSTCAQLGLSAPTCTGTSGNLTLDPQGGTLVFGNINLNGGGTVHLRGGTYNINSISMNGNSTLIIDTGPVFMNVAGASTNQPISMSGGLISNPSYDATQFHILYGGTSTVSVSGGTASAAMVYCPNADVSITGGSNFYGSVVGASVTDTGGTHFHYDRRLQNDFLVAGSYMMSSFTWKKY
jgi:Tfp pilus assembly protein PilX